MTIGFGRLALTDALGVVATADGLILRSPAGLFEIPDPQLPGLWTVLASLLDGRFTWEQAATRLPEPLRPAGLALLDILARLRLVTTGGPPANHSDTARRCLWLLGSPAALEGAIRQLAPAGPLRLACVTTLHDDTAEAAQPPGAGSLPQVGGIAVDRREAMSWQAFSALLADAVPALIVCLWPADALNEQVRLARLAQAHGVGVLYGSAAGDDVTIGPLVTPGGAACWNCARLRRLANEPSDIGLARRRLAALSDLDGRAAIRADVPASGLLGALTASRLAGEGGWPDQGLRNAVETIDLRTLRGERHPLVRLPRCSVCRAGAPDGDIQPDGPRQPGPAELASLLDHWVGPVVGVIQSVRVTPSVSGTAIGPPWVAEAAVGRFVDETQGPFEAFRAWGKGATRAEAMTGALGEAIERYSAALVEPGRLRRARLADLVGDAIAPASLGAYSAAQYATPGFPFTPSDPAMAHDWVRGVWLESRQPVWVPALAAFYAAGSFPAETWMQVTSSGLAAGIGWEDAALRATLELVERHTCMATWIHALPARRVVWKDPGEEARGILGFLQLLGASVEFHLLHAGVDIPTILCLARGDGRQWPAVTVSAAADPHIGRAMYRALLEQGLTGPSLRDSMLRGEAASIDRPDKVRSFRDHGLYFTHQDFSHPGAHPALDALRGAADPMPVPARGDAGPASLAACREALARAGWAVAIVDVTSNDIATTPVRVVRALAGGAQPLYCGFGRHCVATAAMPGIGGLDQARFIHPFC